MIESSVIITLRPANVPSSDSGFNIAPSSGLVKMGPFAQTLIGMKHFPFNPTVITEPAHIGIDLSQVASCCSSLMRLTAEELFGIVTRLSSCAKPQLFCHRLLGSVLFDSVAGVVDVTGLPPLTADGLVGLLADGLASRALHDLVPMVSSSFFLSSPGLLRIIGTDMSSLLRRALVGSQNGSGTNVDGLLSEILAGGSSLVTFGAEASCSKTTRSSSMGGAVLSCLSERLEKAIARVITPQLSGLVAALQHLAAGAKAAFAGSGTSPGRRGVQTTTNTFPSSCPADVIALCTPLSPSALAKEWALLGSSESMDVRVVADFCRLFGHHERSALSVLGGSSPPPKTHPCQQSPSSPSAGGHVGSIINQAYSTNQSRAVVVEGSDAEITTNGLGRVGGHSLGVKRCRDLSDEHEVSWEPCGGSYANGLFLPSASHILGSSKGASVDVLRGLGSTVGLGTLASRRDSMRRLAQLGGALTSSLGPTQSFLKIGGGGSALRYEAGVGAGGSSGDAALPFVTIPLVVGNTSDWLGEKASATANHRWTIYVRGVNNASLSGIVDHVTFVLHPSFPKPQQTVYKEPFMLTEHGWGEFDVTVYVKFKHIEIPVVASLTSPNAVSSPTFGAAATVAANRGIYVKLTHALKFSHRNPMLLAAESRVNQDVAVAMTQPPSVLFGTSAPSTSPAIPGGTNVQSVQFLLTNPTLTTAIPALPETPAAVVHKLHCFPPNGNAYYGVPNYTPFALVDSTVASETRDELAIFHPSPSLLAEVASYITSCAVFTPAASATSLPPAMFSKLMKHSPLLCYSSGKFNEWHLYSHQSLQDKRLLTAVEADLGALMRRYVTPMARDEMRSTALLQLKQVGVQ